MNLQESIERTVTGLGYDLVDVERSARGLLRVSIDRVPGHAYAEALGIDESRAVAKFRADAPEGAQELPNPIGADLEADPRRSLLIVADLIRRLSRGEQVDDVDRLYAEALKICRAD